MNTLPKKFYIFVGVVASVLLLIILLQATNTVRLTYYGFAIDEQEALYIGRSGSIDVYEQGIQVNSIPLPTSKGYAFTIQDEHIKVAALSEVFIIDFDGAIVSEQQDSLNKEFNELSENRTQYTTSDGNKYYSTNCMGYYAVKTIRDSVYITAYAMPLQEYVVKVAEYLSALSIVIFVPLNIYKNRKQLFLHFKTQ